MEHNEPTLNLINVSVNSSIALQITPIEAVVGATGPNTSSTVDLAAIKVFIVLQMFGGIGMLVLLSSAFLSRTKTVQRLKVKVNTSNFSISPILRSRTWYSFCISWTIYCVSYCLLFFAREQFNQDEKPSHGICLVQAALIYSSPPLTGATSFSLFLDVWWMFRASTMGKRSGGSALMTTLFVAPYAFWVILTIGFLIAGGVNPQMVQRDLAVDPYCVLSHPVPPILACSLTLVFGLAVLVMLVILAVGMYRMRMQVNQNSESVHPSRSKFGICTEDNDRSKSGNRAQMLALIIRLITSGLLGVIAITISTVFVFNRAAGSRADLAFASLPPAVVLVFGTQKDFLLLWFSLIQWCLQCLPSCFHRATQASPNNDKSKEPGSPVNSPFNGGHDVLEMKIVPTDVLDIGRGDVALLVLPRDVGTGF
ncbi:hypothetical protein BT96DRAFT_994593 [Gymnopus androsaceus JB14]|uniref:G-protein coupled receptors family 2 profile 2 domain-containing protein n=1 Tax=Gymnopus androsaceus JB14 TaxID=1447944 RepID=A0A6A4HN04_9AGAR|nr:hypothetical protein BT96DRAFT_994593 [Gymnopus androsaceus JB14]